MFYLLLFFVLPALTIWSLLQLFRGQGSGFGFQWQRAFGWLVLWVAPFPFIDVWLNGNNAAVGESGTWDLLISLPHSWMVLYGGRVLLELMALVGWSGNVLVDHQNIYMLLWGLHCITLTCMVGWLLNQGKSLRHPLVIMFGLYMAGNAAAIVWQ